MKVNMAIIDDEISAAGNAAAGIEEIKDIEDDTGGHSRAKTFLLAGTVACGLCLFVWNMTGFVNSMRLDNQGSAKSIVNEVQDFFGSTEGSGAAYADGTEALDETKAGETVYANESEELKALRKEAKDAKNEAALLKQELKNAEDMLSSSLAREAELQDKLDGEEED